MVIDGKTKTCGLIGNPVEHTMSPLIHNTLAEKLGINLVYVPFLVTEEVEAAIKGASLLHLHGLNVTVPHKSEVIPALVAIDPLAEKIGAVNTLVSTEGGFKGYNTDMTGLYRAMASYGISLEGEEVILLGAGGAARAVAFLCGFYGVKKVYLCNRSLEKGRLVAEEVNTALEKDLVTPLGLEEYTKIPDGKYLCIQATSVGLAPNDQEVVISDSAFYEKIHTGFDLIYRPSNTRFMQLVKAHGGKAYHGLKMLLYQGVEAFELWNQIKVSKEDATEVYEKMKGAMGIEE